MNKCDSEEERQQREENEIKILWNKISNFTTEERAKVVREFKPRATDIIVAGCCKSGTTWMQQIVHQLRTGGDMGFTEIMEVVPVIEMSVQLKQDLDADQRASPRCFKTHVLYQNCPKRAKYIYCLRKPCSVACSAFKMFEGWFFQPGEVSLESFVREWVANHDAPSKKINTAYMYFHHLVSWWPHRHDQNILIMFYEDLKESYEKSVRSVATFMGVADEKNIQAALERSTFEYMKQHSDKFDQKLLKQNSNAVFNLPEKAGQGKSKICTGTTTKGQTMLSTELLAEIQQKWEEIVTPVTGCTTYEDLRAMWKAE